MIIPLAFILLGILVIMAIIDWKYKQIPSVFLTGTLFVTMMIQLFSPLQTTIFHLTAGLTMFVFAWMLYEADFIGGIADVKIITIIGLMLENYWMIFITVILILLYGVFYKIIFRYVLKKDIKEEVPFVPCLVSVYVAVLLWQWMVF